LSSLTEIKEERFLSLNHYKTIDAALEAEPGLRPKDGLFHHELIYYIDCPLTLDQWIELDNKMSDVFDDMGIGEDVMGFAGPIPFDKDDKDSYLDPDDPGPLPVETRRL
jgi:hypothetical protein